MIVICFDLCKLAIISLKGWYPPHVDNTDTLYLGDQHSKQTMLDFVDEPPKHRLS